MKVRPRARDKRVYLTLVQRSGNSDRAVYVEFEEFLEGLRAD
jgi:hypothetical protein